MKSNYAAKISGQALDKLMKALEAGKSKTLVEYLKAMGRFHRYSLANTMLIHFQKPDATHVAGYRRWQKLGRYVKKGEHGLAIIAPIVRCSRDTDDNSANQTEDEVVMAFKTAHVFDVSQTDGKSLPEFAQVHGDPGVYTRRLKDFIADRGIEFEYADTLGPAEGLSAGGKIVIKANLKPAEEFSVIVHELSHEILHKTGKSRPESRNVREVEAEAAAFVVCQAAGLDCNTSASDYIQLYDGTKKTLMDSLERIHQTAAEIIEAIMAEEQEGETAVTDIQSSVAAAA